MQWHRHYHCAPPHGQPVEVAVRQVGELELALRERGHQVPWMAYVAIDQRDPLEYAVGRLGATGWTVYYTGCDCAQREGCNATHRW